MVEIQNIVVKIEGFACGSVQNGGWETCVMVIFTCSFVKYENNNKPSSLLEPEKEAASKETKIV